MSTITDTQPLKVGAEYDVDGRVHRISGFHSDGRRVFTVGPDGKSGVIARDLLERAARI